MSSQLLTLGALSLSLSLRLAQSSTLLLLQVDLALRDMLERKAASSAASMSEEDAVGAGVAQASLDLSDTMSEGLRLRSEMQRAVQEER